MKCCIFCYLKKSPVAATNCNYLGCSRRVKFLSSRVWRWRYLRVSASTFMILHEQTLTHLGYAYVPSQI